MCVDSQEEETKVIIWQDYAITVIQIGFSLALMPALFSQQKPDPWTCFLTGSLLLAMSVVIFTLDIIFGAVTTFAISMLWFILLWQSLHRVYPAGYWRRWWKRKLRRLSW